jgi:hypothetical protein
MPTDKLMTFTMPIEKMLLLTLLLATQSSGGSAQPSFLRRHLGTVPCTEEQCRNRFTTMESAGVLTGSFFSYGDVPTKGCFIKGESMYYGTGGTDAEINDSDLDGVQERVWCDATSSNESGNGGSCLTEDQCEEKFTMMKNDNVIDGSFHTSPDFPSKGCFMKGDNVFFGSGGTDDEMTKSDLPVKQGRLLCDGTSAKPQSSSDSKSRWSLWTIIGATVGVAVSMIITCIGLKRYTRKG